jgi:hypothetical protein
MTTPRPGSRAEQRRRTETHILDALSPQRRAPAADDFTVCTDATVSRAPAAAAVR